MLCVPMTLHFKCKDCKSYFKKTIGDRRLTSDFNILCPYCRSQNIKKTESSSMKEELSYIRYKLKKILK